MIYNGLVDAGEKRFIHIEEGNLQINVGYSPDLKKGRESHNERYFYSALIELDKHYVLTKQQNHSKGNSLLGIAHNTQEASKRLIKEAEDYAKKLQDLLKKEGLLARIVHTK